MPTFRVSGDLRTAFVIEIEAESRESAEGIVSTMSAKQIRDEATLEGDDTSAVEIDGSEEV